MTPEAQRIAIAEACGWSEIREGDAWGTPIGIPKDVQRRNCWIGAEGFYELPDYLNDLNAMHEAEKVLDPIGKDGAYEYWLRTVCHIPERESAKGRYFYRATAAQRAEACLKTLGLWK